MSRVRGGAVLLVLVVGGCGGLAVRQQAQQVSQEAEETAVGAPRDLLAEVRAAAAGGADVIEVAPLVDPAVADLLEAAGRAEAAGDLGAAARALDEALGLLPGDPRILQWRAELLLAGGELDEAERLAANSWERGPRLGELCRRNWATVQLAREVRGDPEGAQRAAGQRARCEVPAPVRM